MQRGFENASERALPFGAQFDARHAQVVSRINTSPAAAQVDTLTVIQAFGAGTVETYSIDGVARTYTHVAGDVNQAGVAASIAAQLNNDPLFGGLYIAVAVGAVVTLTARRAGFGWTLATATLGLANVVANATAEAVPFGRLVIEGGAIAGTFDGAASLPRQALMTQQEVLLDPTAAAGASYHVDVTYRGVQYHAEWQHVVGDLFAALTEQGITLTARVPGPSGEDIGFQLLDPGGLNQPLRVRLTNNTIFVDLATDGAGAITSTADQVIAAINAGLAAATNPDQQETDNAAPDVDARIEWDCPLFGDLANQVTFQMRDPGAATQPLVVTRTGLHVDIQLATDGGAAITSIANEVIAAVAANAEAAEILVGAPAGAGTSVIEESLIINFGGAVDGAPTDIVVEATGAGAIALTDMLDVDNLVLPAAAAPAVADIVNGLVLVLAAQLPANSVDVANVGNELQLEAAIPGEAFGFSYGSSDLNAGWTATVTNPASSDINRLVCGVTRRTHRMEQTAATTPLNHGYEPHESMSVFREGQVVVPTEDAVTLGAPVFVRTLAAGGNTVIGGFRASAAAGCIPVAGCRWNKQLQTAGRAVLDINL